MKRRWHTLALMVALLVPSAVHADSVASFHSAVSINHGNIATIRETIVYDPGDSSHHGIYRFVPAQLKDSAGHTYYTTISLISVTDENGTNYAIADKSVNRQQLYLKIGDKDILLSDSLHTYVITYKITPLVVMGDGYDRLILNITGQQWAMPIEAASVAVDLHGVAVQSAQCYTGVSGSTEQHCNLSTTGSGVTGATNAALAPNEGFTIDLKLAAGSYNAYLQPDKVPPLTRRDKTTLALCGLALLLVLATVVKSLWQWWQDRREGAAQTIIPLYEPPDDLRPAQMSVLESPSSDNADIAATIIDLAVHGYLQLELLQAKTWYRQANYKLTKLKDNAGLADFESVVFTAFFSAGDELELKSIKKNISLSTTLSTALQSMRSHLGKDLKSKGYYTTSPIYYVWVFRLLLWLFAAFIAVIIGSLVLSGQAYSFGVVFIAIALSLGAFGLSYLRTDRTLEGNVELAKVKGFKWFLSVTEKDRLAFTDAPDKTPELFSKMLPYAIALKVEKEWAKQFEGIDVSRAVGIWYVGSPGNFSSSAFASDFSSSFSGAVSSSFASSSGGGSAGGGGGGGGGGGW